MVLMCNFSKYLPFINFLGKFCCSPFLLKFSLEIQCSSINMKKTKIIAFGYDQHMILIMYTNTRFWSTGRTHQVLSKIT